MSDDLNGEPDDLLSGVGGLIFGAIDKLDCRLAEGNLIEDASQWLSTHAAEKDKWLSYVTVVGANLLGRSKKPIKGDRGLLGFFRKALVSKLEQAERDSVQLGEQQARIRRLYRRKKWSVPLLQALHPEDFEHWVAGYFQNRQFRNVRVTQYTSDFGVDVYMTCPDGAKAVVQVKRYEHAVGRPVVQQTYGVMHLVGARRCYVVTSGSFTSAALGLASHPDIELLDGEQLVGS